DRRRPRGDRDHRPGGREDQEARHRAHRRGLRRPDLHRVRGSRPGRRGRPGRSADPRRRAPDPAPADEAGRRRAAARRCLIPRGRPLARNARAGRASPSRHSFAPHSWRGTVSNIAPMKQAGGALVTAEHAEAIRTALKSSLYPGASDASVDLVLSYCKAAGLDPMQKPVHIVPMWDGKARTMRDVVMPGIGLYRTNAARTGEFAGMSEPEFGPSVTERLGDREFTFPEWCKVTVYRQLRTGHVAEFTAVEYWVENYAIKGGKDQDQS